MAPPAKIQNDVASNEFLVGHLDEILPVIYDLPFKFQFLASKVETQHQLDLLTTSLKEQILEQDITKVKNLLRCLMAVMNLGRIPAQQVLDLLDSFLEQQQDFYIYLILSSLTVAGLRLSQECAGGLTLLLDGLNTYMIERKAPVNDVLLVVDGSPDPLVHFSLQISNLQQNDWKLNAVEFEIHECEEKLQFNFTKADIPQMQCQFLYPPVFYILPESPNLPSIDSADRYLLNDVITDVIQIFSHNHTYCAKILLNIDKVFSKDFCGQYQIYEAVMEAIFMELFRLPASKEKLVYYNTLVIDLCRENLQKIPSCLGRCLRGTFAKLNGSSPVSGMDVECIRRFAGFTAIHLSNFGFSYKFSDWEYLLDGETTNEFVYVRELLQKCVRLAYYERIKNSIPESFEENGEIFPSTSPAHYFLLQDDGVVEPGLLALVEQLNSKLPNKEEAENIASHLQAITNYVVANPDCISSLPNNLTTARTPQSVAHEALFQCVLFQGSKSFSHLLNIIERHLPLLQGSNDTEEKKQLTCEIISIFWESNSQFLEIIVGKMVNYRIIDPKSVLQWLISDDYLSRHYDQFYVWSTLTTTLSKINLKEVQLRQKYSQINLDSNMDGNDDESAKKELSSALEACETEKRNLFILCFKVYQSN